MFLDLHTDNALPDAADDTYKRLSAVTAKEVSRSLPPETRTYFMVNDSDE